MIIAAWNACRRNWRLAWKTAGAQRVPARAAPVASPRSGLRASVGVAYPRDGRFPPIWTKRRCIQGCFVQHALRGNRLQRLISLTATK